MKKRKHYLAIGLCSLLFIQLVIPVVAQPINTDFQFTQARLEQDTRTVINSSDDEYRRYVAVGLLIFSGVVLHQATIVPLYRELLQVQAARHRWEWVESALYMEKQWKKFVQEVDEIGVPTARTNWANRVRGTLQYGVRQSLAKWQLATQELYNGKAPIWAVNASQQSTQEVMKHAIEVLNDYKKAHPNEIYQKDFLLPETANPLFKKAVTRVNRYAVGREALLGGDISKAVRLASKQANKKWTWKFARKSAPVFIVAALLESTQAQAQDEQLATRILENPSLVFHLTEQEVNLLNSAQLSHTREAYLQVAQAMHELAQLPVEQREKLLQLADELVQEEEKKNPVSRSMYIGRVSAR